MALYLGFDSSTQSLTAMLIEVSAGGERRVIYEDALRFDEDLPEYGTRNGVVPNEDPLVAHSSPLLWADALDRSMARIRDAGHDLSDIRAISGSGQQHGSVYLNAQAESVIGGLDAERSLVEQIRGIFSRQVSPIWMDSSTNSQCRSIAAAVGGDERLAEITGSRAFERFTGPQVKKFVETEPRAYEETARIHLVSSFLATLLAGKDAPIDPGDGAGMNLMNLASKQWDAEALRATAPGLGERLPAIAPSDAIVGTLSNYWVERYGFSPSTRVATWSGDNPCSLIGVGLVETGRAAISLGTSDTLFGFMPELKIDPDGQGHVFGAPTGHFMSLLCFKNGSLARDRVRESAGMSWDGFSDALRSTKPGNGGRILLPWFEAEITPHVTTPGAHRFGFEGDDHAASVRAVVEGQLLSMAIHSEWMGVDVDTIYATGGAARNREILKVMADIHSATVYQLEVGNSACLGAALRALHADADGTMAWIDATRGFVEPLTDSRIEPDPERHAMYSRMREVYSACEQHVLGGAPDPTSTLAAFRSTL